jgi:signal transduction histidine kinase
VLMGLMMLLAVSPFVFSDIKITETSVVPEPGVLMLVFSSLLVTFFLASVFLVVRKYFSTHETALKKQWLAISVGLFIAYTLLIFFVFLRVITLNDTTFVPYSPLFLLPIFVGTAYAILKHHLFKIKVIAAETLTFLLLLANVIGAINSTTTFGLVLSIVTVGFVLVFGILLVKNVLKEVEQRELLEELNKELEEQKAQVEELSNFKTQLLSFASHQLKAPMAVIKGYASILLEGLYGPVKGKVRDTVVKMRESTDELISLINTLLDLRRIDEGRMEYQFTEVKLGELTAHVIDGLAPLAEKKKLKLTFKKPDHPVRVHADGPKLAQVIGNLVENAIKYTERGSVEVTMTDDQKLIKDTSGNDVMVTVKDTGLGISETLLPNLFQEFSRDERVKKEIRGTGLGLYIAKKMLEAHEGIIWAESAGEGKGSTFLVKLKKL